MGKQKEVKTNAMRILDRMKISYQTYTYECDEFVDGKQTADLLGFPHEIMFKTLVTVSPDKNYFVFVIPIDAELDLKKAAHEAAQKSLAMIHVKEINQITGYIRGGCTAIGMKKQYPVFIDESAVTQERIIVSGGKIGAQIELKPQDLASACGGTFCALTRT
jgi:Cys-tRNA(Pro)/Cys-tRNA(Cys) deacylase